MIVRSFIWLALCCVLTISPVAASAQPSKSMITKITFETVSGEIAKLSGEYPDIRNKVITRLAQCAVFYRAFPEDRPDREKYLFAADIYLNVAGLLSSNLSESDLDQLMDDGIKDFKRAQESELASLRFVRNCHGYSDPSLAGASVLELAFELL